MKFSRLPALVYSVLAYSLPTLFLTSCDGGGSSTNNMQQGEVNSLEGSLTESYAQKIGGAFQLDGWQGLRLINNVPSQYKQDSAEKSDWDIYY